MSTLDAQQKRIAKRHAGYVIPDPPPQWIEVGEDERLEWLQDLIEKLNESRNSGIAKILEANKNEGFAILREKIKSMRRKGKSIEEDPPTSEQSADANEAS